MRALLGQRIGAVKLSILAWVALTHGLPASSTPADFASLQRRAAEDYCDPSVHMSLAKAHHDQGRRLLAFGIVDHLKRYRSSPASFRRVFGETFQTDSTVDASDAGIATLLQAHLKDMKDVSVITDLGRAYGASGDWERAEAFFSKAHELQPKVRTHVDNMCEAMNRRGRNLAAEKLMADFVARNDGGPEAMIAKIEELLESDRGAARKLISEAVKRHPQESLVHFYSGQMSIEDGNLGVAQQSMLKAAKLGSESARMQGNVAGFFLNVVENTPLALDFYLNAYFLDPNFHDGKYVDDRVRTLARLLGAASVQKAMEDCETKTCLEPLLSHGNSAIVLAALTRARESDEAGVRDHLVRLLSHDHPGIRSGAMLILKKRSDPGLDAVVRELMSGDDLTALGLSCYLAVSMWGEESFGEVQPLLSHPAEIVRFDAMAALALEGGEDGLAIVERSLAEEPHPVLRSLGAQLVATSRSQGGASGR